MDKRYEELRRYCATYAGIHPDELPPCHASVKLVRYVSGVEWPLAIFADDAMLYIHRLERRLESAERVVDAVEGIVGYGPAGGVFEAVAAVQEHRRNFPKE